MAAQSKHVGAGVVAVLYVALALIEGGSDPKALAVIAVLIWWLVIIGLVIRAWPGTRPVRAAIACGSALAGLGLLTALSLVWADDAGRAFEEVVRVAGYLGLFVLVVLASRRGSSAAWASGLTAGLAAVATLALFARFEPGLLTDGAGDLADAIPSAAGRLSYPIGYWNGLGAVMGLAVVALLWMGTAAHTRLGRALAIAWLPLPVLAIYLAQSLGGAVAACVGVFVLLLAARERWALSAALVLGAVGGGLLALAASMREELVDAVPGATAGAQGDEMLLITIVVAAAAGGGWYAFDGAGRRLRSWRPSLPLPLAAGAAIAALIAAIVVVDPAQRWADFKDPGALAQPPSVSAPATGRAAEAADAAGNGRYQWWSAALDGWRSEPVTGLGAGNYELHWNAHNTLPVVVADAHSLYLEALAELGIPGLLLLAAFFASAIAAGVGRRRSSRGEVAVWLGMLAAGMASAAGEWTWEIPAATAPLVVAAAVLTGPATLRPRWPRAVDPDTAHAADQEAAVRRSSFGLGVATMLVAFACIWSAGALLLTTVQLDESRAATDAGDLDEAASNASYAAAIEPWSAAPKLQLAQVEELRGRLDAARSAAEDAIELSPEDWRTWVVLARIAAREGDAAEAREARDRAQELSPVPLPVVLPEPQSDP